MRRRLLFVWSATIVGCGAVAAEIPDSTGEESPPKAPSSSDSGTDADRPLPSASDASGPTEDDATATPAEVAVACGATTCGSRTKTPACCLQVVFSEFIGVAPTASGKCQAEGSVCAWDGNEWHQAVRVTCERDGDCAAPARCRVETAGHTRNLHCSDDATLDLVCVAGSQCGASGARQCKQVPGAAPGVGVCGG